MAKIKLRFKVNEKYISNLRFGITFVDNTQEKNITELNSYYGSPVNYSCHQGIYDFYFLLNKMQMSPGRYSISIIVTSGLDVLDWIKDAGQVIVSDGLYYETDQMPLHGSYPVFFSNFDCELSHVKEGLK